MSKRASPEASPEAKQQKLLTVAKLAATFKADEWPENFVPLEAMKELIKLGQGASGADKATIKNIYMNAINELLLGDDTEAIASWAPLADDLGIGSALILDWVKLDTQITPAARIAAEINKIIEADAKIVSQLREAGLETEASSIEDTLQDEFEELLDDVTEAVTSAMRKHFPKVDQDPFNLK